MSNDRRVAAALLNRASDVVGKERGPQHGTVEESFTMIAELWSAHINHAIAHKTGIAPLPAVHLSARDVALMMGDVKRARAVYGDQTAPDNYVDIAGYASLAGMLSLADPRQETQTSAEPDPNEEGDTSIEIPAFLKQGASS